MPVVGDNNCGFVKEGAAAICCCGTTKADAPVRVPKVAAH